MLMLKRGWLAPIFRRIKRRLFASAPTVTVRVHSLLMRLDTSEAIQSSMAKGTYEPQQTAWARDCLAAGDRFVDIGANFGWYTALAAGLVGPTGQVFAFEPSPVAANVLAHTIKENRLHNVTLVRAAVGDTVGHERIYMPQNQAVHSPSAFHSDPTFVPLQVPLLCLDRYEPLADGRPIKLVKIDVEGYEPNVLRGMQDLVRKGMVKNLFSEFNSGWLKRNATTPAALFDLITASGYAVHKKTSLKVHPEQDGEPYELQDIWFTWPT
jgi:FkbM family methyltransferase